MRGVLDVIARLACPQTELPRQQRVRRLIGRQVRGDVQDAQA
jgi:hypothetical protein